MGIEPEEPATEAPKPVPGMNAPKPPLKLIPDSDGKFKGAHMGIDTTKLEAYIGSLHWKIRPDGHTKKVVDAIRMIQKISQEELQTLEADDNVLLYDKEEAYERCTKQILELGLVAFNYETAANHVDAGPAALGMLAGEVRSFLVDLGGREGSKHLQMLSRLATQNISAGIKD